MKVFDIDILYHSFEDAEVLFDPANCGYEYGKVGFPSVVVINKDFDENGNPKLIEVNTTDFSYWLYQFNGKAAFGEYTDDLLKFCKDRTT